MIGHRHPNGRRGVHLVAAITVAAAAAAPALARPAPERNPRERARTFLVLRIAEELDLSDEKALELSRALRTGERRRAELEKKRRGVERRLRDALRERKGSEELERLVREAIDIDRELALVPHRSLEEAMKVLTPEQQARLVLFQPRLREEVRRAVRRRMERWERRQRDR